MKYSASDIRNLVSRWGNGDWTENSSKLNPGELDKAATNLIINETAKHIHKGHFGRTYNWALLALSISQGSILKLPGFLDAFKPSTTKNHHLTSLATCLRRLSTACATLLKQASTATRIEYLSHYTDALEAARTDTTLLLSKLKASKRSGIALLTLVEQQFCGIQKSAIWPKNPSVHMGLEDLSREESASAVSFALSLLNKSTRLSAERFLPFLNTSDDPGNFEDILLLAFRLRELQDMEASIFRLNYRFFPIGKNKYIHTAETDQLGMSLALGYIKNQWIASLREDPTQYSNTLSFEALCTKWLETHGNHYAFITDEKIPQVRVALPSTDVKALGEGLFRVPRLFQEEIRSIFDACYELNTNLPDLESFKITPELSLFDTLIISRIFRFIFIARFQRLLELRNTNLVCLWNSSLVGIKVSTLREFLHIAGVPLNQATAYISLFTWNPEDTNQFVDLQYRSFINLGGMLAVPLAIHTSSNLFRNALIAEGKRIYSDGTYDPISHLLETALKARTPYTASAVKYRHQTKEGDIDVLGVLDNSLYIFECKNTLLPTSTNEQQTTHDHIQKATKQLERFLELWNDKGFRSHISQQSNLDLSNISTVKTAIVLSNRLFSGTTIEDHPVRHHRELINILKDGKTTAWSPDGKKQEINLWAGESFSKADLDDYLSGTSKIYSQLWASFDIQDRSLSFLDMTVVKRDFVLNQKKYLHETGYTPGT